MIKSIEDLPIAGKRVFLRLDFNVPLSTSADGTISVSDDTRIQESLPTISYAMEKGAKLILASHLGRPKGRDPKLSLEPVAKHLSSILNIDVLLTDDCVGDGIEMIARHLKAADVILLENLRFHKEEEDNDLDFARSLANLAEVYITDAFGTTHRKHASTYGVPNLMHLRGCGYLIRKELNFLQKLLEAPEHPYVVILGGSKVSDKIKTIENLFLQADSILVGGAMAHAFCLAKDTNFHLPESAKNPSPQDVENAHQLIEKAKKHDVKLILPVDDHDGFDIGPKTIEAFSKEISKAKTIFWNGPVGIFEKSDYAKGTMAIAEFLAESKAIKIVGGGDTAAAINRAGVTPKIDHVSTGGGATLEFLEGKGLPGIEILQTHTHK